MMRPIHETRAKTLLPHLALSFGGSVGNAGTSKDWIPLSDGLIAGLFVTPGALPIHELKVAVTSA